MQNCRKQIIFKSLIISALLILVCSLTGCTKKEPEQIREVIEPPTKETPAQNQEQEEGLVAFWDFEEGEGSILNDRSGQGIGGEIFGATWTEGVKGQALAFGGDDYVEIKALALEKIGALEYGTISLWFKFSPLSGTEILPLLYFGEANNQGTTNNLIIEIGHFGHNSPPDQKLYYTLYNNAYEPVLCFDSGQNLKEDTWYHFAVVNTPQGNTGYLNGQELTKRHYNFGKASDTQFFKAITQPEILRLGYGWFGIDQEFHFLRGVIDELRIYNKALSNAEIAELAKP